jgi:hypothetical protein
MRPSRITMQTTNSGGQSQTSHGYGVQSNSLQKVEKIPITLV